MTLALKSLSVHCSRDSAPQPHPLLRNVFCLSHQPSKGKSAESAELTVLLPVPEAGQNPAHSPVLAASLAKIRFTKAPRADKLSKNPFCKLRIPICFLRCFQQTLFPGSRGDAVKTFCVCCIAQAVMSPLSWAKGSCSIPTDSLSEAGLREGENRLAAGICIRVEMILLFLFTWSGVLKAGLSQKSLDSVKEAHCEEHQGCEQGLCVLTTPASLSGVWFSHLDALKQLKGFAHCDLKQVWFWAGTLGHGSVHLKAAPESDLSMQEPPLGQIHYLMNSLIN